MRRRGKFNAKPTVVNGIRFASKAEARRYQELLLLEKARKIYYLQLQPKYVLEVNGHKVGTYIADFRYDTGTRVVVEDVKGIKTPVYRLKAKLMKAIYDIDVLETR